MNEDLAKRITDLRHSSFEKFNGIVVSVSSGALALTVAFRDNLQPSTKFGSALLSGVWVAFVLCVLLGTFQALKGSYIAKKAARQFQTDTGSMEVKPIPFFVWAQRVITICFCAAVVGVGVLGLLPK